MKTALDELRKIDMEINSIAEKRDRLQAKRVEMLDQQASIKKMIDQSAQRLEEALTANVLDKLDDSEVEKVRLENSGLENKVQNLGEKNRAIETALRDLEQLEKKLIESRIPARLNFLLATSQDLAGEITDQIRDIISQIWVIRSRMPGASYDNCLRELFPQPNVEETGARWTQFVRKWQIEH